MDAKTMEALVLKAKSDGKSLNYAIALVHQEGGRHYGSADVRRVWLAIPAAAEATRTPARPWCSMCLRRHAPGVCCCCLQRPGVSGIGCLLCAHCLACGALDSWCATEMRTTQSMEGRT